MDGAQFAKMLSDKHLFELNWMEYKYSTVSVKEFAELLRQNFAQPLPLTDFSGNKLFYLPNLAQISTNGMKQLLSVPVSGQNFGLSAMTEEIYATFQIESIRSTRSSIRYILDGYAPRDEQEARIYGMKRGLEFIANRQNTITEENLHYLYQISTGDYLPDEDRLLPNHFYRHGEVFIVGGEEPRPGLPAERLPGAMKCLVDFANANDGINELHKAAILHFAFAYYHPYFDGNGRTARLFHLFFNFPLQSLLRGFTRLDFAARKLPLAFVVAITAGGSIDFVLFLHGVANHSGHNTNRFHNVPLLDSL